MIKITNIKMPIEHSIHDIKLKTAKMIKASVEDFKDFKICKKSIDARDKNNIFIVYSVDLKINNEKRFLKNKNVTIAEQINYVVKKTDKKLKNNPVVIGSGPAGLFAALILAESGLEPIILEQGKKVEDRKKDVEAFWKYGILNESSNVQFGEGGAGTFSDGKLTTGINDRRITKVLNEFVLAGAAEEILYIAKPHIGTDVLERVVKNIREKIISYGGKFYFEHKFIGFTEENNKLKTIVAENNRAERIVFETEQAVLALGHSARDTFKMLHENNIGMRAKSFSVGVRIEHNQKMINEVQFGTKNEGLLSAADYKLNTKAENGRGVYTFCMCPGGLVVAAASEKNHLVTNGMSYYSRELPNANSALLVSIHPMDYSNGNPHPLSGIDFQRELESRAFMLGGGNYFAPVQLVGDFLKDIKTTVLGSVEPTYNPGYTFCHLKDCLDDFIVSSLKEALLDMDKKIQGFAKYDSVLTAVESRSSSPVCITRNEKYSSNIEGMMPCGEGAGYAGGIMSAAVDGMKCAEFIIND